MRENRKFQTVLDNFKIERLGSVSNTHTHGFFKETYIKPTNLILHQSEDDQTEITDMERPSYLMNQ